jgi:helix-turn-helix protein
MDLNTTIATCKGLRPVFPNVFSKELRGQAAARLFQPNQPNDLSMKPVRSFPDTKVLMAGCVATTPNSSSDWHSFPFDEFYLISGGNTCVGIDGKKHKLGNDTLILIRQGEKRAYWNIYQENPTFWAVFFRPDKGLYEAFPSFQDKDPLKRVWHLTPEQSASFKSLLVKIATEHSSHRTGSSIAEASWLRLLMVTIQRWIETGKSVEVSPELNDPDVLNLWQKLNEMVWQNPDSKKQLQIDMPNYDSVRHRFQKAFGLSPQKLLMFMRMEHAKSLLLETSLNVKEIANKLGYLRQHEFTRAFHKLVGVSPSAWRSQQGTISAEPESSDFSVP